MTHQLVPALVRYAASALALFAATAAGQSALTPGDVAVIGWHDAPTDDFAIVLLRDFSAGTELYFTDNGWTSSGFHNPGGATDGNGSEDLAHFALLANLPAGTIVRSTDISPDFAWTTSGAIPGAATGSFSTLDLGSSGDQIYVFQHSSGLNPLNTAVQNHLYALDDTGAFENATSDVTGAVPPGLSVGQHTALTFNQRASTQNFMSFNTSTLTIGTKEDWLVAIANAANWTFGSTGTLPSGPISVYVCPAIETKPDEVSVCPGTTAVFSVGAVGTAPLSYQWRRNGALINDSMRVTGSHTATMTINPVFTVDAASFDVVVSNTCGSVTSTPQLLIIDPTDTDGDGTPNCSDDCPTDPLKIAPGQCGCGVPDTDDDGDGTANCLDGCPTDPLKIAPGVCGCGVPDADADGDGTLNCLDGCPDDPLKIAPGICGCGVSDIDTDGDGTANCIDGCPLDPLKIAAGICGCGTADTDTDLDGTADCLDLCPLDPLKIAPGVCGCGVPDGDTDGDGTLDCLDGCPLDPLKTVPGQCGCGFLDTDDDGDGTANCVDGCPLDPSKIAPGQCGCGFPDTDSDGDGSADCVDGCPTDPAKTAPGQCGCNVSDLDTDGDGTANCNDLCPLDPLKIAPGICGCGTPDTDSDGDGIANCNDNCPFTVNPIQGDGDGDGVGNACDNCPSTSNPGQEDCDANGQGDVCQLLGGSPDCNFNHIPDVCDITSGHSLDADMSGIPDECEVQGGVAYCFGDGISVPCPCSNPSVPGLGQGCRNSTGSGGRLIGAGMTNVSSDTLVFTATGLPTGSVIAALLFQGNAQINGGFGTQFYDGLVCAGGTIIRIGTSFISAGSFTYPVGADLPVSVRGLLPVPGGVRYYQLWYRNAVGPCGTFANITNGIQVVWRP